MSASSTGLPISLNSNLASRDAEIRIELEKLAEEIRRITEATLAELATNKETILVDIRAEVERRPTFQNQIKYVPAGESPADFKKRKLEEAALRIFELRRPQIISERTKALNMREDILNQELFKITVKQKERNKRAELERLEAASAGLFPLEITIPPETKAILESAKGIFSFTMYTSESTFDNLFTPTEIEWSDMNRNPILYLYGTLTYVNMCTTSEWDGWKVCIFTTRETLENNPKTVDFFTKRGALLIPVDVSDVYKRIIELNTDPSFPTNYKQAIRAARYYPLFHFDCPVFIRDADTLFESTIHTCINNRLGGGILFQGFDMAAWPFKNTNPINDDHPLFEPSPRFVIDISIWEQMYMSQCLKFGKKFYLSYDNEYELAQSNNYISSMQPNLINPGNYNYTYSNPSGRKPLYHYSRFLAGCVSSFMRLPESVWLNFKTLIKHFPNAASTYIDEYYLTFVIYPWLKKHRVVGFFMANYFEPAISILRAVNTTLAGVMAPCLESHGLPIDFVERYVKMLEKDYMRGSWKKDFHEAILFFFLICPSIQLMDEAFFSPLEGNIKNAPRMLQSFPEYSKFGRRGRRATRKARKLRRKSRKA